MDEITITKDKSKIDLDSVIKYLNEESYWAKNRTKETIITSIDNSICYSLIKDGAFVGFSRVVTDKSTFAYLCDVFVKTEYQNSGYGHLLMNYILNDEEINKLTLYLLTKSANIFYKKFGFMDDIEPKRLMYKNL